jgi:hypothetical protein
VAGLFALRVVAEGTDILCSTAVMILLQLSSAQCRSHRGHSFKFKFENGCKGRGTHDLAIGSYKLGFLLGYKAGFGLDVIHIPTYSYLL